MYVKKYRVLEAVLGSVCEMLETVCPEVKAADKGIPLKTFHFSLNHTYAGFHLELCHDEDLEVYQLLISCCVVYHDCLRGRRLSCWEVIVSLL